MVSPTLVSRTCLIDAVMKPISPGPSASTGSIAGRKTPMRSTLWRAPVCIIRMESPFLSRPSTMRTSTTTPR